MSEKVRFRPIATHEDLDSDLRFDRESLRGRFQRVRENSVALTNQLEIEDQVIQTCEDVSPTKWHLAHTTWFFETFILSQHLDGYESIDDQYAYLFNSYYQSVGPQFFRPRRGHLSRPTVAAVHDYRGYVERWMGDIFDRADDETWALAAPIIEVGLHHEQQHQELILTDIKDVLSYNPMAPAPYSPPEKISSGAETEIADFAWVAFAGGVYPFGHDFNRQRSGFAFDNESPCHDQLVAPFEIGSRLVTNREYLNFVEDGGYTKPHHWLSDAWATVEQDQWQAPVYWRNVEGEWHQYTLHGLARLDPDAPVSHVSFYETAAYASWAEARLPTEFEWELAASDASLQGNFLDIPSVRATDPMAAPSPKPAANTGAEINQLFGDVWEWTQSPYTPYRGFKPLKGNLGEYNGKFMCNQMVLRGGSCATPRGHMRSTYRNFFFPHARWQFSGIRLARDT